MSKVWVRTKTTFELGWFVGLTVQELFKTFISVGRKHQAILALARHLEMRILRCEVVWPRLLFNLDNFNWLQDLPGHAWWGVLPTQGRARRISPVGEKEALLLSADCLPTGVSNEVRLILKTPDWFRHNLRLQPGGNPQHSWRALWQLFITFRLHCSVVLLLNDRRWFMNRCFLDDGLIITRLIFCYSHAKLQELQL